MPKERPPFFVAALADLRQVVLDTLHRALIEGEKRGRGDWRDLLEDERLDYVPNARLAKMLDISTQTLARWRAEGLPYVKPGASVFYHRDDIRKWMERHRVQ